MSLKMGTLSLDSGTPEITPQQERGLSVEQSTANLGNIERQLDVKLENNNVLAQYPEEVQNTLKDTLMKECFIRFGENPNITNVTSSYNFKNNENTLEIEVNRVLSTSIQPDGVLEDYKLNKNPEFNLEGLKENIKAEAIQSRLDKEGLKFDGNREVLSEAFKSALQYRSDFIADRNDEIKNTSWFNKVIGRTPEKIPHVGKVPLSKDEILKHVPQTHKGNEQLLKMLDEMVERLDKSVVKDNFDVEFWDVMKTSTIDTAKTVDAFVEVAVAEGLNTGTKIGMNVGAVTLGTIHGIKEGSLDEGITAMREIREGAVEQYRVEARESSKEILANSETLQAVGTAIHDGMEWGYNKIGENLGDEAQFIARGATEAIGDIAFVAGAGWASARVVKNVESAVNSTKGIATNTMRSVPTDIYLKTENIEKIIESGRVWGQTEGSVYGLTKAEVPKWQSWINDKKIDPAIIHFKGEAAALFQPHEVTGVFSGLKKAFGQYKAPFGDLEFLESSSKFNRATRVLTIESANIGDHMGQSYAKAMYRLWSRRIGEVPLTVGIYLTADIMIKNEKSKRE